MEVNDDGEDRTGSACDYRFSPGRGVRGQDHGRARKAGEPRDHSHPGPFVRRQGCRDGRSTRAGLPGRGVGRDRRCLARIRVRGRRQATGRIVGRNAGPRLRTLADGDTGDSCLAAPWQLRRLPSHRARVGARSEGGYPRGGRLPARGGFPHARDPRRGRYRARRNVRGHRGTGDRGGGRRDVGKIERAEPTDAGKEKRDGTYGSTSRKPEADAADLPDHGAHAAAPLVRPGQDGNETGLWPPGRAGRSRGTCRCPWPTQAPPSSSRSCSTDQSTPSSTRASTPASVSKPQMATASASAGTPPIPRPPLSSTPSSRHGTTATSERSPPTYNRLCSWPTSEPLRARPCNRPTATLSVTAGGCGSTTASCATSIASNAIWRSPWTTRFTPPSTARPIRR